MQLQLHRTLLLGAALLMGALMLGSATIAFADTSSTTSATTSGATSTASTGSTTPTYRILAATLLPSMEVPSVQSSTTGQILIGITDSVAASGTIRFALSADGSDITDAHLHCGRAGTNGPVVVPLFDSGTSTGVTGRGTLSSGALTGTDIATTSAGCANTIGHAITSLADLRQALLAGEIYANLHTTQYPGGAARGQIAPTSGTSTNPTPQPTQNPPSNDGQGGHSGMDGGWNDHSGHVSDRSDQWMDDRYWRNSSDSWRNSNDSDADWNDGSDCGSSNSQDDNWQDDEESDW